MIRRPLGTYEPRLNPPLVGNHSGRGPSLKPVANVSRHLQVTAIFGASLAATPKRRSGGTAQMGWTEFTVESPMKRSVLIFIALALAGFASVCDSRPAIAADVTLYELTENMAVLLDDRQTFRVASSALTGWATRGTVLCPETVVAAYGAGASACVVNASGSDRINTKTGKGGFDGTLTVVVPGDNAVDGPELVVMRGSFRGKMDFAPALLNGIPFGTVTGSMKLSGHKGRVPFSGIFRLPFAGNYAGPETGGATLRQIFCPATPSGNPYAALYDGWDLAYISTSQGAPNGSCINIGPKEMSLGSSLVRFEITFGGALPSRDDD